MKHQQPNLFRLLTQSLNNQSLSHAYLLSGDSFLLESAYWVAGLVMSQSDNEKIILEKVNQFKEYGSVDFKFINGSLGTIKKEEVNQLQLDFQNTALEATNQKVVIIHQIQNATLAALNSILKFLEEPSGQNTTFILTTSSIGQVLPTILSRCIVVHLEKTKQDYSSLVEGYPSIVESHLQFLGVNQQEADEYLKNNSYLKAIDEANEFLENFKVNKELTLVNLQRSVDADRLKVQWMFELICQGSRSLLYNETQESPYSKRELSGFIKVFTKSLKNLNPSTNLSLCVDEVCADLMEEIYGD